MLSYSFHHNNSPAYKYRRTFARRSATSALKGTSVQLRAPLRSDRYPLFLILRNLPLRPSLLATLLLLAFPRSWTAVKQSRSAPPPLTIRIKPFNCRIVFDGSFSPAKLLFKLVPGYVRTSGNRLLPLVSPCSITFTHNVTFLLVLTFLFSFTELLFVDMFHVQFTSERIEWY